MFERFTKDARRVVVRGVDAASELGSDKVGPQHLLFSLVSEDQGVAASVLAGYGVTGDVLRNAVRTGRAGLTEEEIAALRSVGVEAEEVFRRIEEAFGSEALEDTAVQGQPRRRRGRLGSPFDQQARKVLELSLREAIALRHRYIGTEHILLALLRGGVPGPMGAVLADRGVTYDDAKRKALAALDRAA